MYTFLSITEPLAKNELLHHVLIPQRIKKKMKAGPWLVWNGFWKLFVLTYLHVSFPMTRNCTKTEKKALKWTDSYIKYKKIYRSFLCKTCDNHLETSHIDFFYVQGYFKNWFG